jgi:hypothetical protein
MADPLKLNGRIVTAAFAFIDLAAACAKQIVYELDQDPPVNEADWRHYYRLLIRLQKPLDEIQRNARTGLDAAQGQRVISQTSDPKAAVREVIAWLEKALEEMEEA